MTPNQILVALGGTTVALLYGGYHLYLLWYAYFVFRPAEIKRKTIEAAALAERKEKITLEQRLQAIAAIG